MPEFALTAEAHCDLEAAARRFRRSGARAAREFLIAAVGVFEMLAKFPRAGRARSELAPRLRSFPIRGYVVLYRAAETGVTILRVVHGSRDLERIGTDIAAESGDA